MTNERASEHIVNEIFCMMPPPPLSENFVLADSVERNDIAICASPLPSSHSRSESIAEMTTTIMVSGEGESSAAYIIRWGCNNNSEY